MIKVIRTWRNDEFFYAEVEETRRFFFQKNKIYTVYAEWYPYAKQRSDFFYYLDTGKPAYSRSPDINQVITAYEARNATSH